MRRLAWSQLRFRSGRALALLAGMLVAATAFTVLTGAARTAQIRTVGTVNAHFQPAYDILVRPAGVRSSLEQATGTVQPDFLSGIYGGITMAQWHEIEQIAGVQVAAPIAMVGYDLVDAEFPVQVPAADLKQPGRQLYRATTTWVSQNGTTTIPQPPTYVYVTPNQITMQSGSGAVTETTPDGSAATPCPVTSLSASPFSFATQASSWCWSKADGRGTATPLTSPVLTGPGYGLEWAFPMLIAAVDPQAEAELDGLNHAMTSGQYLPETYAGGAGAGFSNYSEFPVLAVTDSGVGEYSVTKVQELPAPSAPPSLSVATMERDTALPGHTVLSLTYTAKQVYKYLLGELATPQAGAAEPFSYWSVGAVRYQRDPGGTLVPVAVRNPDTVWAAGPDQFWGPPMENADTQYRTLQEHLTNPERGLATPILLGTFDQSKIESFDPLSQVPLGPYQPTVAAPANAATSRALGGKDLQPNLNMGGLVTQPVQLVTSLASLPALENSGYTGGAKLARAPLSVIRVRVAGVTGPDQASLDRVKSVAQQIEARTHLTVDIVVGSSPAPTKVAVPAGKFGAPAMLLTVGWVKKGIAVSILNAVDHSSVVLFILILVVCALFVANSASAAVRGRRQELGVLAALGWTRPRLFATVLGEVTLIGLVAGVLGALLALPLAAALGLHASPERAALAIPVALALAVVAGAVPAWLATRTEPVAAARPPVLAVRRARQPRGITGLATVNVLRTPGRTVIGALSLAVGVAALTLLVAVTTTFRGAVTGTLLGDVVTVQVRGVDYIAVAATVILGVLAVADALLISITERAPELATMRSFGWPESALRRLILTEGALTGLAGSAAGAAVGLAAAAVFAGRLSLPLFAAAAAAAVAGVLVTSAAALLPAHLLRRLPVARLLAQE
jgi:putative ABC transport system permease protein